MSILDMDNSINASEGTALPVFSNSNFITIEEIVVFSILIAEEDEMAAPIINVEWI
jgi:hypothetical protein